MFSTSLVGLLDYCIPLLIVTLYQSLLRLHGIIETCKSLDIDDRHSLLICHTFSWTCWRAWKCKVFGKTPHGNLLFLCPPSSARLAGLVPAVSRFDQNPYIIRSLNEQELPWYSDQLLLHTQQVWLSFSANVSLMKFVHLLCKWLISSIWRIRLLEISWHPKMISYDVPSLLKKWILHLSRSPASFNQFRYFDNC
jgi:hypothetical protein